MTQIAEQFYAGGFVIREAPGMESRIAAVLANLSTVTPLSAPGGLVLSFSPPAAAAAAPLGTNTGNGTVGAISTGPTALPSAYVITMASATSLTVEDNPTVTSAANAAALQAAAAAMVGLRGIELHPVPAADF